MTSFSPQIGPYTITRELGRGGMGVVYLGRDTRLDRAVAIKALPEHLASDPDRLARFEREAKTLASLSHPNIAGIFGLEEHAGARYLVLEYVEGQTLAETLDRGPLPVDEAIELAVQVAAGVEAAHEAGVIHRDLKPANIIVTLEGQAKVLDFGLARVEEASSSSVGAMSDSPTLTSPAIQHSPTMPGVILGTAAYMSPEQARGRKVDKRTDIWSFGVVFYEMLTGTSPFHGETVSDSIGAVLHKEVDFGRLPPATPADVRRVLARCLERDKAMRYRDIGDARLDLLTRDPAEATASSDTGLRRSVSALLVALALVVVGVGAWLVGGAMSSPTIEPGLPMHLAIPRPVGDRVSAPSSPRFAVDHASRRVVFIARDGDGPQRLVVRPLDSHNSWPILGTEHATDVTVSPDGSTVLFIWSEPDGRNTELRRVSIEGGPVTTLKSRDDGPGFDLSGAPVWRSPTSVLLLESNRLALHELSLETFETRPLVDISKVIDGAAFVIPWSVFLDGQTAIVSVGMIDANRGPVVDLYAFDLVERRADHILNNAVVGVVFDAGRRIAFGRLSDATLCVARFDIDTRSVVGQFVSLHTSVADYEISPDGDLYYATSGSRAGGVHPVAIGLDGARKRLTDRALYLEPFVRVSPDGGSLGLTTASEIDGPPRAEILNIDTGFISPVVDGPVVTGDPVWISDDDVAFVLFQSMTHVEVQRIRIGSETRGSPIAPIGAAGGAQVSSHFSPDGRWMAYQFSESLEASVRSIYIAPTDGAVEPRPLIRAAGADTAPAFSPNNQWLAYHTDAAGENRVVMRGFQTATGDVAPRVIPVSQGAGMNPVWSPDGAFLYFVDPAERCIKRVFVEYEPVLRLGAPEIALTAEQLDGLAIVAVKSFDIFPDGERFAAIESPLDAEPDPPYINVTLNWLTELQQLMPVE